MVNWGRACAPAALVPAVALFAVPSVSPTGTTT